MKETISFLEEINMITNVGGWEMDLEKEEMFWTASTKRLLDLPEDFKPGFNSALLFNAEEKNGGRMQHLITRAVKEGIPFNEEFQLTTAKGREIWIRSIAKPVFTNGRCVRLCGSVQDITESKLLIEKNTHLTKLYDVIVQICGNLIQSKVEEMESAITDAIKTLGEFNQVDHVLIYENDRKKNIIVNAFGWCNKESIHEKYQIQNILLLILDGWKDKLQEKQHLVVHIPGESGDNGKEEKAVLLQFGIQSLVIIPMVVNGQIIGYTSYISHKTKKVWNNQTISLLRVATDLISGSISRISYEKTLIDARHEAEAQNLAKSDFILNMGHVIKTRLHEILGFSKLALNTTEEEKTKQPLEIVAQSGTALLGLFDDLLKLSQIEITQKCKPVQTSIEDLMDEIKQIFLPNLEKRSLLFHTIIPENLPLFSLDLLCLKQILINLAGNAIKFTLSGNITVFINATKAEAPPQTYDLAISINDTGIGMTAEVKKQITDFFDQPGGMLKKRSGEIGLGLYIVKKLLGIMQGSIELESQHGKGTSFTIRFTNVAEATKSTQQPVHQIPVEKIVFKGQKILMVDDVITHFLMAQSILENLNLHLINAKSGEEGIEMANELLPDLILMDINMDPGMNGYEATRILKENEKTRNIAVIAFTTDIQSYMIHADILMFDDLLEKVPMDEVLIIEKLKQFLDYETHTETLQETVQNDEFLINHDCRFQNDVIAVFGNRIKKLIKIIDLAEIENLIDNLKSHNKERNLPKLDNYIKDLQNAYSILDFERITSLFKDFEKKLSD